MNVISCFPFISRIYGEWEWSRDASLWPEVLITDFCFSFDYFGSLGKISKNNTIKSRWWTNKEWLRWIHDDWIRFYDRITKNIKNEKASGTIIKGGYGIVFPCFNIVLLSVFWTVSYKLAQNIIKLCFLFV